ncbi:MAG: thiamine pyrophosphate-binding protein [Deltaproteobacteria bacterium]|nr:thiamine pyrophosphate-binding protein [Deltaproteobacteria bacterium]
MNGGAVIARTLNDHGVRHVFTLIGGHISPILTESKKSGIRVVDVRQEADAVFAADSVSRLTGSPGVAVVTAGPGIANSITALVNAKMAQSPLIVIAGASPTVLRGRGALQDIDQPSLARHAVKAVFSIKSSCDFVRVLESAFALAQSGVPGPVLVECPIDLVYDEQLVRKWYLDKGAAAGAGTFMDRMVSWYLRRHVDRMYACDPDTMEHGRIAPSVPEPDGRGPARAAAMISRAERPVMVLGSQAVLDPGKMDVLLQSIGAMGVPVYLAGMARGLLGIGHPLQFRHRRDSALAEADLVVLAGMPCDFRLDYGRAIGAKAVVVSVNRSKRDLTLNRRPALAVNADPAEFLVACSASIVGAPNRREWIGTLRTRERQREDQIRKLAEQRTEYINPLLLLEKIDRVMGDKSVIVADGGDFVASASYIVRPRGPLSWLDPGVLGTLGVGAGFAIGAKLCRPGADVWLLWGDGAAGFSLIEFDTMVRHGIPVIAVIGNDAGWTQIARDQVEFLGDDVATALRYSNYHEVAQAFDAKGFVVNNENEIEPVLRQAVEVSRRGTPVLVNALIGKTDFRKGSISM